ncbi:MAG TPA: hypothetical protein PKJ41_12900 [Bryobacteraceae bacterium]|nr:hypothetical protein [Bryobacteraceae bacterium]
MTRLNAGVLAWAVACLSVAAADPPTGVPTYDEAGVVQLARLAPGPVAPNTLMSIFGKELAWVTTARPNEDETINILPVLLSGTGLTVAVNGLAAPVEMVSPEQVNFLIPATLEPGKAVIRLVMNGRAGPKVELEVVEAAPAVFCLEHGVALARHEETFEWVDKAHPAKAGELLRLYVSGLGQTEPALGYRELPRKEAEVRVRDEVVVRIGGVELTGEALGYVGVMPGFPGIYEIRFTMPETEQGDPEIRVWVKEQGSQVGVRLVTEEAEEVPEPPAESQPNELR